MRSPRTDPLALVLRVLVAAGLVVDAVVHLRLASGYQMAQPAGIGQGNIFRIESVVALLAALYVLLRGSRTAFLVAAVVGLSALVAVVLYRYVEVPAIGPVPTMYEPIWFFQKTLSAVAEALAGVLALVGLARVRAAPRENARS
ncbi:MAG: hypothetical protein ACR2FG_15560 [Marmoricola sp.]